VNGQDSKAEIFDVFLCHNSEDKPAVRAIAQMLVKEGIKPWLDEEQIRPGTSWQKALRQQIENIKSAAVLLGESDVGPWQNREIIGLLDEFEKRGCPVIPVILASDPPKQVELPWSLNGLHCVDFRSDAYPLERLIWGITGKKPQELVDVAYSEQPVTLKEAAKSRLVRGKTRLYRPLTVAPDEEQANQLQILRAKVVEYWVDGVLKHSLYNEVLISLGKRQIDKAIDAPWKYTVELSDTTNSAPLDDRDLSAIYDATGSLLILGEPGSGKTTTLLDLAQTLLERAGNDTKERVPVVVNLSNWQKNQSIAEWIVDELWEKYWVPRKIGRLWFQQGYLLPMLDGLDEVETVTQPDCVAAINAFIEESIKESKPTGLVVCCRLNEYRRLPERLKLNGAICIEPLSLDEVSKYLAAGGAKLAALREALETDPVLHELSQTPLMLSIMSLAYQGARGDELTTQEGDFAERRKQVFRLYVEQMFQRKGTTSLAFPKEKIIGWLSWLARKMVENRQSVFLVEGLQPSWLSTRAKRIAYRIAVFLSLWLIFGLSGGLIFGLIFGAERHGLIFGLIFGLGLSGGFWSGLISGKGGGSLYGFTDKVKVDKASPNQGIKLSLKNSLVVFLVIGLSVGLSVGLFELFVPGLGVGHWLAMGLNIGLALGLLQGGLSVIQHYALRLFLWWKEYTPLNFVKFLDQCARLTFLEKVGGGYIFIHRMLLDYFADLTPQSTKGGDGNTGSARPL
jgi:DNA polymerase III delta prime subunit